MRPNEKIAGRDELWWIRGYADEIRQHHYEVVPGHGQCCGCQEGYPCMTRRLCDAVVELSDIVMEEGESEFPDVPEPRMCANGFCDNALDGDEAEYCRECLGRMGWKVPA